MLFNKDKATWLVPLVALAMLQYGCDQKAKTAASDNDSTATGASQSAVDTMAQKMVLIKGGTFPMGSSDPAFADAMPVHNVTVNSYYMD